MVISSSSVPTRQGKRRAGIWNLRTGEFLGPVEPEAVVEESPSEEEDVD